MSGLSNRYELVKQEIREACQAANRDPGEVTLIVVTKNHPVELVSDLLALGHRDFGENRDQEAKPKAEFLAASSAIARSEYRWHFVGQLQTNKVKSVLKYADYVHSLDRPSLLAELTKVAGQLAENNESYHKPGVFIQLNLTDDPDRGGIMPSDLERFASQVLSSDSLELCGVMAVASLERQAERDFEIVQMASEKLRGIAPEAKSISAGMSSDFQVALRYGATHLRIGTAITGNR